MGAVDVDVAIIGGGVNGTGVARDAAMRGLKVALFERNDLAFGASGNSSGMIHGGPRYLTDDPAGHRTSCLDSGHIQAIAPHLLFRIPFLMPIEPDGTADASSQLVDAFFEAYDRYQPLKHGKPHARLTRRRAVPARAGPLRRADRRDELVGGITFDEWGIDGARLCVANAVDAHRARRDGAHRTRASRQICATARARGAVFARATAIAHRRSAWRSARARSSTRPAPGRRSPRRARPASPPSARACGRARESTSSSIGASPTTRSSRKAIDGRQIFIEPWQNMSVARHDRRRLLRRSRRRARDHAKRCATSCRASRASSRGSPRRARSALRGRAADALRVRTERGRALARPPRRRPRERRRAGLYSMIGGKLASYRLFAEEMTDIARAAPRGPGRAAAARNSRRCPEATRSASHASRSRGGRHRRGGRARLVYRHGSRAQRIVERIRERPLEASVVCPCEPVIEAEVRYAVRHEMAASVDDVARRTRLGLGACGGMRCAARCGQIVAEELRPRAARGARLALRFLVRQAKTRAVAVGPAQASAEALVLGSIRIGARAASRRGAVSTRVVVIGAGVAGTAAAYAARADGAEVTLVGARPGATALGSGAIDGATVRPFGDNRARVLSFFEALGLWEIDAERCRVATCAGILREVRGRDRAVLDLSRATPGAVAVVDAGRRGWDATSLARAWSSEPWAKERGLRFEPVKVEVLRLADETSIPDSNLAARHDDPERVRWLGARLREWPGLAGKSALVMGPWLGLRSDVAQELSRELGVRVGEPLSGPGGVAGLRFEHARDALVAKSGVRHVKQRASAVRAAPAGRTAIELETGALEADAVVLALGGLAAGGIAWAPARGGHGFELSVTCAASFAVGGRPLLPSGSPRGALFEPFAWSGRSSPAGFERVGIWTDAEGRARDGEGKPLGWLYAAGDVAADAPRTLLEAIRSGIAVGTLAARSA